MFKILYQISHDTARIAKPAKEHLGSTIVQLSRAEPMSQALDIHYKIG